MASLLRPAPAALAAALASGPLPKYMADLFQFTLARGTTFYWTSWETNLTVSGNTYVTSGQNSDGQPFLKRGKWSIVNTMSVPSLDVTLLALNSGFTGGAQIKNQIINGLFDGASFLLSRVFMPAPGDVTTLGGKLDLFGGVVGGIDCDGLSVKLTIKGKNNNLDQYAPRSVYQTGCNHAFCDVGCTLSRASFTASFSAGTTPTRTFIPWVSAPGNYSNYLGGTLTMTSGLSAGQSQDITAVSSFGLTLAYPLSVAPSAGDSFTAFQGCDKTFNSGSGRSCTDRSNTQNYDGFEFVPPPNSAY